MRILTFTPRTTAEAVRMNNKVQKSNYNGIWNNEAGRFEFEVDNEDLDSLENALSKDITNDIFGYYDEETMRLTGKRVKIDPFLTTDPHDKRGEAGFVITHVGDILTIRFDDGSSGMYFDNTVLLLQAAS